MKKIISIFALIFFMAMPSYSFELNDYRQIKSTLRDYSKALSERNIDKIKEFYTEDYKDSDGFSLEESIKMFEKTYSAYDKMKQKTKINSITSFDNYAIVQLTDKTSAVVLPSKNILNKNASNNPISSYISNKKILKEKQGILEGKSVYSLYFKKIDDKWKIFYDEITAETTSLKYGIANDIKMQLDTPISIKEGEQYDLSLKIDKPDNVIAIASIVNEEILYPIGEHEEKFRKFPSSGELERVVRANKNKNNECAIASVGFTKVSVNEEETKARIEVIGMAFLMKRINMINPKENNEK